MRLLRIALAIPLIAVGAYLALVSLLVGCASLAAGPPERTGLPLLTGLPTSLGEWVVGAAGMVLIGLGWALATGGRPR
ncbi:MAG: hypothetical protein FJW81_01740 [Actinobacteria bacterium]|nr:hypothetical protein [Actinomycetota bacterium]